MGACCTRTMGLNHCLASFFKDSIGNSFPRYQFACKLVTWEVIIVLLGCDYASFQVSMKIAYSSGEGSMSWTLVVYIFHTFMKNGEQIEPRSF